MKNITVIGSTGSIGTQTLDVVKCLKQHKVVSIAANSNILMLETQIREFKPKIAVVYQEKSALQLKEKVKDTNTKVLCGMDGLIEAVSQSGLDLVVMAVSGMIGILPLLKAIENKIDVAIATKEILVSAGQLIMEQAKKCGVNIIPIDSEHSAIMQCIEKNNKDKISRIILTASGGPFRGKKSEELKNVTVNQALSHPNWKMGKKITIDSATLMNKGLEVIEAKWLFDIDPKFITILIHPQSIIHSMVEYIDNTVIAQLAQTDMRIPIQYALTYPKRLGNNFKKLDFSDTLSFEEPDYDTFKALRLCYEAVSIGGTMPVVLNSSNETAVELFLNNKIGFLDIHDLVKECMNDHKLIQNPSIDDILKIDTWSREIANYIATKYN